MEHLKKHSDKKKKKKTNVGLKISLANNPNSEKSGSGDFKNENTILKQSNYPLIHRSASSLVS